MWSHEVPALCIPTSKTVCSSSCLLSELSDGRQTGRQRQNTWLPTSVSSPRASGGLSLAPLEYLPVGSSGADSSSVGIPATALFGLPQPQPAASCGAASSGSVPHVSRTHNTSLVQAKTKNNAKMRFILTGQGSRAPAHVVITLTSAKSRGQSAGLLTQPNSFLPEESYGFYF